MQDPEWTPCNRRCRIGKATVGVGSFFEHGLIMGLTVVLPWGYPTDDKVMVAADTGVDNDTETRGPSEIVDQKQHVSEFPRNISYI